MGLLTWGAEHRLWQPPANREIHWIALLRDACGRSGLQRVPDEEPIERLLSTMKPLHNMIVATVLDDDRHHWVFSKTPSSAVGVSDAAPAAAEHPTPPEISPIAFL
jgi:hypothetical protein